MQAANNKASVYGWGKRCHPQHHPLRKQQSGKCWGDTPPHSLSLLHTRHTNTRLTPSVQATHWGLIDAAHSYWTKDVRGSQGNYKQPPLWDRSLEEAWGRRSQLHSGNPLFTLLNVFNSTATGSPYATGNDTKQVQQSLDKIVETCCQCSRDIITLF